MIENLPLYISLSFIVITLLTILLFYKAASNSKLLLLVLLIWIIIQGIISCTEFYKNTNTFPPRFALLVIPPLLTILILFVTEKGKMFLDSLDLKMLTYLQTIRVPVEIILLLLFLYGFIPELMTFEGRNFDILAGITAPVIAYFGFDKKIISNKIILIWNIVCLVLVLNIVINAVLSAPFPFQTFAFEQPNVAVFYFPFTWLPGCIVPIVILSHLASIRQLLRKKDTVLFNK